MPEPSTEPASPPADTVEAPPSVATTESVAVDDPAPVEGREAATQPTADPEPVDPEPVERQSIGSTEVEQPAEAHEALADGPTELSDGVDGFADEAALAHRRTLIMVLLAIVVLAIDQISKSLVVAKLTGHDPVKVAGGAVYLLEVTNKGAAFNLGEGYTALFTAVAAAVVVVMVRVSSRLSSTGWAVALGLVLGGAAGNLTDRLFRAPGPLRGAVVDWISLFDPEGRIWPVFNLADSAIVCGGVCAVILMLLGRDLTLPSRRD